MDEKDAELHRRWSQADVEYQKRFQAHKAFDDRIRDEGIDVERGDLETASRLEKAEKQAEEQRELARRAYYEYTRRRGQGANQATGML